MSVKTLIEKNRKPLRVISAVIAFAIIAWLLFFAVIMLGNPISYFIVKGNAGKYVAENYADDGYVLERVDYSFKGTNYYARVEKPGSEDCQFTLDYNMFGGLLYDDYERRVTGGDNVSRRLDMCYRELTDSVFNNPAWSYSSDIEFGRLIFEGDDRFECAIPTSELVPDSLYDIQKLGARAGILTVCVNTDDSSPEKAAEVLLTLNEIMEQGGAPFYAVDLSLRSPNGGYYDLKQFQRSNIYPDGLEERVSDNHRLAEEREKNLDKEKV